MNFPAFFSENKNTNQKLTFNIDAKVSKTIAGRFCVGWVMEIMARQFEATVRPSNDVFCARKYFRRRI